ncbi:MAG: HIT family protein [Alphaproteobacteria bacterium]
MTVYDPENIFAKILRGEIPSTKVFEDEMTYALMDIMPRADGHTLVLPKAASRNIFDVAPADLAAVMATAQKIANAQMRGLGADGVTIQQFNEDASGQVVFHTHIHVMPRFTGVKLRPHTGEMANPEQLEEMAIKLRDALG